MSRFVAPLDMRVMWDADGNDLRTREGRQLYQLLADFIYQSDIGGMIIVKAGFVTDLGSVPRLPIVYDLLGDITQEPYVIHDFAYSTQAFDRKTCDDILDEALAVRGISWLQRKAIYAGVRIGGGSHWVDA